MLHSGQIRLVSAFDRAYLAVLEIGQFYWLTMGTFLQIMWTDTLIRPLRLSTDDDGVLDRIKHLKPMILVWWCFALSTLCSSLARFIPDTSGISYYAMVIMGSGGCAWFWFLSRALFRDKQDLGIGVFSIVPVVMAIEAIAALVPTTGAVGWLHETSRLLNNAASMVCIAFIAFVWHEALHGFKKISSDAERRLRLAYVSGFGLLVAITLVWMSGAKTGSFAAEWHAVLLTACSLATLAGSRVAIQYRLWHSRKATSSARPKPATMDDESSELITQRIVEAVHDETLLTTPNLKVAEFAEHIGEQEYKVTRAITNCLGYRNFNHFLNHYRIERAKCIFDDADNNHLTIATTAYESGYNSLGPFNRAFKQYTGMTPREYRQK